MEEHFSASTVIALMAKFIEVTYRCPKCGKVAFADSLTRLYQTNPDKCSKATANEPCNWSEVARREVETNSSGGSW